MKKIILMLLIAMMLVGCSQKCPECSSCEEQINNYKIEQKEKELKDKLIEYGKLVYENDNWLKSGIDAGTYLMTLNELSERNNYDISMFVNPITGAACDKEKTRIEFILKEKADGNPKYEFNPVLDCGF